MNRRLLVFGKRKAARQGATAVEFAIVLPLIFLPMLFAAMEFGRLFYVWNTVQEVSRNAARQAVVTNFNDTAALAAIRQSAVFRSDPGSLPGAADITSDMVKIRYLTATGAEAAPMPADPGDNIAACLDETRTAECIRFVEACVSTGDTCPADQSQSLAYAPMTGWFAFLGVKVPVSTVRMPAESLGFSPDL